MGKRGPAPKPTATKILEGTFRKDRAPDNEPRPTAGTPVCPSYLNAEAKREWKRIVPELERLGLLTVVDGAALEGYCASYGRAVKAEQQIKAKGIILKTPYGPQTNPAVAIARQEWAAVRKFAAEFGLTPSARTRVSAPKKPEKKDPTRDWLFPGRKHA